MKPFEKNIKILTGPENSSKTYAAKIMKLAFKRPFYRVADSDFLRETFFLDGLEADNDVIIVDDVQIKDLDRVLEIFTQPYLRVNSKFRRPNVLETPRVLITLNDASEGDLKVLAAPYIARRVDLLKCYFSDNGLVEVERVDIETPELIQ
ncbi:hypothetical protein ACFSYG_12010 [Leeuwenhoekiella polynyae]|uniref:AAA domain-containing protein n=1 Tax=Leeuwenhoekiella polynyae TaxID=1550906 RepID=A0A4Q0PFE4_9FLAO|nr:hypothetical protein [Leeuwenhoekiella polynyae]RXG25680.1 hypothetical protein DSM02_847 [Leeuwenhoekiella polynyae]